MLIEKDSGRWKRLIVGVVLFMVVTAMVYKNSMLIGAIDSVLQALIGETNHSGSMTQHLMTLISFDDVDQLFGQSQDGYFVDISDRVLPLGLQI